MYCKHSLHASLERLRLCDDEDDKVQVYKSMIKLCDSNWLRCTYEGFQVPFACIPPPLQHKSKRKSHSDEVENLLYRFKQIVNYLPPDRIAKKLFELEKEALLQQQIVSVECDSVHDSGSTDRVEHYGTPPKRRKRRSAKSTTKKTSTRIDLNNTHV